MNRFLPILTLLAGCGGQMSDQPRQEPLEPSARFPLGMASRSLPPHTVARGQLREDESFYTGRTGPGTNLLESFPLPITIKLLREGRESYEIYCAPCHGLAGEGNGMIVQRGFPQPPSYHIDRLRHAPVGHFYHVMTQGYGVMFSYANSLAPADRWKIAAYIRAIQLSQRASFEDVPESERAQLDTTESQP